MNTAEDSKSIFEKVRALSSQEEARVYGTGLWKLCHRLANVGYPPAKEFFIKGLEDPRWDWRRVSVELLGSHYKLEHQVIDKICHLLLNDPDSGVRIASAYTIGKQTPFPEKNIIHALVIDSSELVREAAFSALLEQAGVAYKTKLRELDRVRAKEITPNLDQVKRILIDENLSTSSALLEEK